MIEFVETETRINAYFSNPLNQEKKLIGSCELFVSEDAIAAWKRRISTSHYAQVSEILELIARFSPRNSVM